MSKNLTLQNDWIFKSPVMGDHIRVKRPFYYHHGIYVSDSEVIHFNTDSLGDGLLGDAVIISSTLKEFLDLGKCEVKSYGLSLLEKPYPPEIVVERAISRLGESGYNVAINNCEQFAEWCKTGMHRSRQIEHILIKILGKIFKRK